MRRALVALIVVAGCGGPRAGTGAGGTTTPTSSGPRAPQGSGRGGVIELLDGSRKDVAASLIGCFDAANKHDWSGAAMCHREDAVMEASGETFIGRDAIVTQRLVSALVPFPDLSFEPQI